jgi:hypothetical protein
MNLQPIGILAAVAEEINAIKARVVNPEEITTKLPPATNLFIARNKWQPFGPLRLTRWQ